jgi:hypothetical protein
VVFDHGLELVGYRLLTDASLHPQETLAWVTVWRATAGMPPMTGDLQAFVHLLDAGGQVRSGQDRFDSEPLTWEAGDLVLQVHQVRIPGDAASGTYQVELGLYIPDTMQRLAIYAGDARVADRLLLQPVEVREP